MKKIVITEAASNKLTVQEIGEMVKLHSGEGVVFVSTKEEGAPTREQGMEAIKIEDTVKIMVVQV